MQDSERAQAAVAIGEVIEVRYPFVRDTYTHHDCDSEGSTATEMPTWRPGVRDEITDNMGGSDTFADALGAQILTVHGVYKPEGAYKPRVFFTRKWRDPDGREFGKRTLHIKGLSAFTALTRGYRHHYELREVR